MRDVKKNNYSEEVDLKRFCHNRDLFSNGDMKVKNAAIMIFGKDVKKFIPQSKISICQFPAETITDDFSKIEIEGDLIDLRKRAILEVQKRMTTRLSIKGFQRTDVPEYPEDALREAITNAIIHRDYFDRMEISIKIFKDRIEILNPANFPFQGWKWETIQKERASVRRNPKCAEIFEKLKLMEKKQQD